MSEPEDSFVVEDDDEELPVVEITPSGKSESFC